MESHKTVTDENLADADHVLCSCNFTYTNKYSNGLKSFAMPIHCYSTKAYELIQKGTGTSTFIKHKVTGLICWLWAWLSNGHHKFNWWDCKSKTAHQRCSINSSCKGSFGTQKEKVCRHSKLWYSCSSNWG